LNTDYRVMMYEMTMGMMLYGLCMMLQIDLLSIMYERYKRVCICEKENCVYVLMFYSLLSLMALTIT